MGEISTVLRGASPRPIKEYITNDKNGVPWIKIGDISENDKYVFQTKEKITKEGSKKSRVLKKGDFILSNSMSYGRPYILKIDGAIHDGWAAISNFQDKLLPEYLYYYLTTDFVKKYWEVKMNTSSVSNLNSDIIKSLIVPVPPLEVQKIIVEKLTKFQDMITYTKGLIPKEIELRQKQYEYYREQLFNFGD